MIRRPDILQKHYREQAKRAGIDVEANFRVFDRMLRDVQQLGEFEPKETRLQRKIRLVKAFHDHADRFPARSSRQGA